MCVCVGGGGGGMGGGEGGRGVVGGGGVTLGHLSPVICKSHEL